MRHIYTVAWGMTDEDAENIAVLENCAELVNYILLACKSRQCQGDTSLMLLATSTIKGNLTA